MKKFHTFLKAAYRSVQPAVRKERLLEQAALAIGLVFALRAWIDTGKLPYPTYLLCGLGAWYYYQETLMDIPGHLGLFNAHLKQKRNTPVQIAFIQAIVALPTLLFWMAAAVIMHIMSGMRIGNVWILPYMLFCNVYNAIMQSILIGAITPLLENAAGLGVAVLLPFFFWTTPLAWAMIEKPTGIYLLMLWGNPLYYLAEGMREALLTGNLPAGAHTLVFFFISTGAGLLGAVCASRVYARALPLSQAML